MNLRRTSVWVLTLLLFVHCSRFTRAPGGGSPDAKTLLKLPELDQPLAVSREWPVQASVPFKQGTLTSVANLGVIDTASGRMVPSQNEIAATWEDGSVKWAHLHFIATYRGKEARSYALKFNVPPQNANGISLTDNDEEIRLYNGKYTLLMSKHHFAGLELWLNGRPEEKILKREGGLTLKEDGVLYHSKYDASSVLTVVQKGPLKVTLKLEGTFTSAALTASSAKYVLYLTASYDSPVIEIKQATVLTKDMRGKDISELGLLLGTTLMDRQHYGYDKELRNQPLSGTTSHLQPQPSATEYQGNFVVSGATARVTLLVKDFWQKFPQEVTLSRNGIGFWQWPLNGADAIPTGTQTEVANLHKLLWLHTGKNMRVGGDRSTGFPKPVADALATYTDPSHPNSTTYSVVDMKSWLLSNPDGDPIVAAKNTTAEGLSLMSELALVVNTPEGDAPDQLQLFNESPVALAPADWNAESEALGPYLAGRQEDYPEMEQLVLDSIDGVRRQSDRLGLYGKFLYGDTIGGLELVAGPKARPELYRVRSNSHYHNASTPWLLFYRGGAQQKSLLHWARRLTGYYSTNAMVRSGNDSGKFFHISALVPWGGPDRSDWTVSAVHHYCDPDALLWSWFIDGNRWSKDGYDLFAARVTPLVATAGDERRDQQATLYNAIELYRYSHNRDLLTSIHKLADRVMSTGLRETNADTATFTPYWLSRFADLTHDEPKVADYISSNIFIPDGGPHDSDDIGINAGGFSSLALSASAYRISGDVRLLERHFNWLRGLQVYDKPASTFHHYGLPQGSLDAMAIHQWPYFLHALRQAGITTLKSLGGRDMGTYPTSPNYRGAFNGRSSKVLYLVETPAQPYQIKASESPFELGDIHPAQFHCVSPSGVELMSPAQSTYSHGDPSWTYALTPFSEFAGVTKFFPVASSEAGLHTCESNHEYGTYLGPMTPYAEALVLRRVDSLGTGTPTYVGKTTRGYITPLVNAPITVTVFSRSYRFQAPVRLTATNTATLETKVGSVMTTTAGESTSFVIQPNEVWYMEIASASFAQYQMEVRSSATATDAALFSASLNHLRQIKGALR